MSRTISVRESIYSENDTLAAAIHASLAKKNIFTVNVLGGAGAGKTSTLINVIQGLGDVKTWVVEGDIESDIDTRTFLSLGVEAVQINTGGDCHLNASMMQTILPLLDLRKPGILFIENIGNLVCPAEFVIGENIKLLVCSVPEGSDKPWKYPLAFKRAAAVILNKTDLLPYVKFDRDFFDKGVRAQNPDAPIFAVSSSSGAGFPSLVSWLQAAAAERLAVDLAP